jgi:hypothetical protein
MTTVRMNNVVFHPSLVLLATSLSVLLAQIDTSVVNLALKSIAADLQTGVSQMQWVVDAVERSAIFSDVVAFFCSVSHCLPAGL